MGITKLTACIYNGLDHPCDLYSFWFVFLLFVHELMSLSFLEISVLVGEGMERIKLELSPPEEE